MTAAALGRATGRRYCYVAIGIPEETSAGSTNGCARANAKWLVLPGPDGQCWRLPDDTNLDFVEAHLKAVMNRGEAFVCEVHGGNDKLGRRVVLNGRALPFVELYETRD